MDELEVVQQAFGVDFAELAALFVADSPARIAALRAAVKDHDAVQIAKVAHAFSGSTGSIGAIRLSSLCQSLEINAKSGTLTNTDIALLAIEQEYARIKFKLGSMVAAPNIQTLQESSECMSGAKT